MIEYKAVSNGVRFLLECTIFERTATPSKPYKGNTRLPSSSAPKKTTNRAVFLCIIHTMKRLAVKAALSRTHSQGPRAEAALVNKMAVSAASVWVERNSGLQQADYVREKKKVTHTLVGAGCSKLSDAPVGKDDSPAQLHSEFIVSPLG